MRVLVVAATEREIVGLREATQAVREGARRVHDGARASNDAARTSNDGARAFQASDQEIDILITGIGMVATAAQTARALAKKSYDVAFNFGVCGSFDRRLEPGRVVHVVSDRIAELGAEDDGVFLTMDELGLPAEPVFVNAEPPANRALAGLPAVAGITVNTVHGNERSIAAVARRFAPQVESMEGAAFMYACLMSKIPFAQVRAVSNIVEKRNRAAWNMDEATRNLGRLAVAILGA
jgi:futalosine hydrolase